MSKKQVLFFYGQVRSEILLKLKECKAIGEEKKEKCNS